MLDKNKMIINSLLDTDLYKFTMLQALLHKFPSNIATYEFHCRNGEGLNLASIIPQLNKEIDHLCSLRFTEEELNYLSTKDFFKSDFIEFLRIYQLNKKFVNISGNKKGELLIQVTGPQIHVMLFEIYVLAIVNELFFRQKEKEVDFLVALENLNHKIQNLNNIGFSRQSWQSEFEYFDFGTRRRFSFDWQEKVIKTLKENSPFFRGTSNVYFAKKYNLTPIGTMAHEYLQTFQAVGVQLVNSQKEALESWSQEYRGDLGIALTDVISMDAFLADFDLYYAKLFDGLRHDSGDPFLWAKKAINHYEKLKIETKTKRLVFSDGLNVNKVGELYKTFNDKVKMGFGIGTNLTNDVGLNPLNIVMKIVSCNNQPVAKLSDSAGKTMCKDQVFLDYLKNIFNYQKS